jgi:hypothetical protein
VSELQVAEPDDVLVPLSPVDAERLDKRIRLMAQTTRDNFEKVGRLLGDAKRGQVHEVLGFKSWTAYVADAVGGQIQLSGDARAAMVQMLAGEGMSVRAIAVATGVSKSTVSNDLNQVSETWTAQQDSVDSGVQELDTSEQQDADTVTVTGLDNKTYTKSKRKPRANAERKPRTLKEPAAPERRVQIPTAYREKVDGLRPLVAGLKLLMHDPRWPKSAGRFNHMDRARLDEFIAALQEFRAAMGDLCKDMSSQS